MRVLLEKLGIIQSIIPLFLAGMYREMGNYAKAELLCHKALDLRRKALGEEHPHVAFVLEHLADLYYAKGNYKEAEELCHQALEIYRKALGEEHPNFARSLNYLAGLYYAKGNYKKAEELFHQALEICRKVLAENDPCVASTLNNLALLYCEIGKYKEAEELSHQALEICRKVLGEEHPDFATSLDNQARLCYEMGDYTKAEPLYCQALEIRRKVLGEKHQDFTISLDNKARLYRVMGDYTKAEPLYCQALEIRRKVLGEEHPEFAVSLNNFADLNDAMGNYAKAESLYQQALEIYHKALGEEHPHVAIALDNLAKLYYNIGNYAKAEPLYRQALDLRRKALGEEHPQVATCLNNLATLYHAMGNYKKAEELYSQALEIYRKALGEKHPHVATNLNNLAAIYRNMGNYAKAEEFYSQALDTLRKALGEDNPEFALSLHNLANLYYAMSKYTKAEELCCQALQIWPKVLGDKHPHVAASLTNLAKIYHDTGNYAKAEPLCCQALEICCKVLGEEHPHVATSLNNLADIYGATSRKAEAIALKKKAALINEQVIGQIFSISSENTRMAYLKTLQGDLHRFLSLIFQSFYGSSTEVREGLDLVLRRKAIGAEALAAQRDAVLGGRYPLLKPDLRRLTDLRMQIGQKTLAGPGSEGLQVHQQRLAQWNDEKEDMEAKLAQQIPEMNLTEKLRAANRHIVANALPKDSVLVEFFRLSLYDFKAVPAQGKLYWQPSHYLAFVLPAQEPDNVRLIDLGQAAPIDLMIATFRASITGENELDNYHREVLPDKSSPSEDILDVIGDNRHGRPYTVGYKTDVSNGTALRELLFDPLKVAIGDRKRLFLAPDGDLTRLPFEVLPTDDGRYLIDEYYISYLSTGRDVLRFEAPTTGQYTDPIVAADPDFDFADGERIPASENTPFSGRQSRDLDRGGWHFTRLPGTRQEGEQIAKMLKVKPWIEQAVLEARLKACRSPRILHIATHGFFLPDQKRDFNSEQLGSQMIGGMNDKGWNRLSGVGLENPLLRSGLALAGANTWLKGLELHPEAEDNMLTAEDVSGLDLLDTELVVLSACETGLGHVHTGEGVFGLRRSFVLAGAKTLVMSLWKVPDRETQELMEKFYRRLLEGRSRTDALRETQLEMKTKYPNHPLYWGAFICQGDPKPLQKHDL